MEEHRHQRCGAVTGSCCERERERGKGGKGGDLSQSPHYSAVSVASRKKLLYVVASSSLARVRGDFLPS